MSNPELERRLSSRLPGAYMAITPLPAVPQLSLWLLAEDFHHYPYSAQESAAIMEQPPYWCFCWASGQVLARHILQNPERVKGKSVLDFGAGSGVVAIAAALAGAARVVAVDIDQDAIEACRQNALLNEVAIETVADLAAVTGDFEILTAADVLYDLENIPLLARFVEAADQVWIADSRAKQVAPELYQQVAQEEATTLPDYGEFDEFKRVKIYQCRASLGSALPG